MFAQKLYCLNKRLPRGGVYLSGVVEKFKAVIPDDGILKRLNANEGASCMRIKRFTYSEIVFD
ncbi:MAG TPA: hypothetical protein DD381_01240 [Lentisphaeria bacterium]|nr:MAG: hypothetical protein A2X47_13420 [Lentisphaerae bacterium GWF2_38_69]HBM14968.1 hypothetical protein [Lentisphaeria bacterium]